MSAAIDETDKLSPNYDKDDLIAAIARILSPKKY